MIIILAVSVLLVLVLCYIFVASEDERLYGDAKKYRENREEYIRSRYKRD